MHHDTERTRMQYSICPSSPLSVHSAGKDRRSTTSRSGCQIASFVPASIEMLQPCTTAVRRVYLPFNNLLFTIRLVQTTYYPQVTRSLSKQQVLMKRRCVRYACWTLSGLADAQLGQSLNSPATLLVALLIIGQLQLCTMCVRGCLQFHNLQSTI